MQLLYENVNIAFKKQRLSIYVFINGPELARTSTTGVAAPLFLFFLPETKVYIGNLGTGAGKGELERAFSYYGPLRTVWIARNPPGFAFAEFEDPRDAEDAVRGLDGK